jgi:hypothetical protein
MIHTDGTPTIANAPSLAARKSAAKRRALGLESEPAIHPEVDDLARALAASRGLTLDEAREALIKTTQVDANAMAEGFRLAGELLSEPGPFWPQPDEPCPWDR